MNRGNGSPWNWAASSETWRWLRLVRDSSPYGTEVKDDTWLGMTKRGGDDLLAALVDGGGRPKASGPCRLSGRGRSQLSASVEGGLRRYPVPRTPYPVP